LRGVVLAATFLSAGLAGLYSQTAGASNDCDGLLTQTDLPADAEIVTQQGSMQFNGLDFCMLVYQTDLLPDEVYTHYQQLWNQQPGELHPYPATDAEHGLMLIRHHNSRSVQVTRHSGRSTVELGLVWAPEGDPPTHLTDQPRIEGFEVKTEFQDEAGRLLSLEADIPAAQAASALIAHFNASGWTLTKRTPATAGSERIEMHRHGALIDIRLVSTPPTTTAAITFLEAPGQR